MIEKTKTGNGSPEGVSRCRFLWMGEPFYKFPILADSEPGVNGSESEMEKIHPRGMDLFHLVEMGGVEPPSESVLTETSPGADGHLHSLIPAQAVTLRDLVAS